MTLLPVESWIVYPRESWREDMEIIIAGVKARTKPGGQETDQDSTECGLNQGRREAC